MYVTGLVPYFAIKGLRGKKVALNAPLYQENESILKLYQFHVRNKLLFNHILMMISTPKSVSCSFFARM